MNNKILALSVALAAMTAAASIAEAGGGIKLNFGLPLGAFTATPSHGGGNNHGERRVTKRKPAPEYARRPPAQETRKVSKSTSEPEATKDETTKDTNDSTATDSATTGSTALIQTATPPVTPDSASDSDTPASTEPATEAPANDTAAVSSDEPSKPDEAKADETKSSDSEDKVSDVGCKKFIPAIGLTVSVDCKNKE